MSKIKPHQFIQYAEQRRRLSAAGWFADIEFNFGSPVRVGTIYTKRNGRALLTAINKYPNPQRLKKGIDLSVEIKIDTRPFNEAIQKLQAGLNSIYNPKVTKFMGVYCIEAPY